jgi:alpha-tubulin suppressor-like RCC1 family protein
MLLNKKWLSLLLLMILSLVVVSCSEEETETMPDVKDAVERSIVDVHRLNTIYIEDGDVFIMGENNNGQLGVGDFETHEGVQNISSQFDLGTNDEIIQVSLGEYHAMALSQMGKVFIWGHNAYGKLTLPAGNSELTPVDITDNFDLNNDETVVFIEAGRDHNGLITSDGRVFTWGANAYGQLGNGTTLNPWESVVYQPSEITFDLEEDDFIIDLDFGNNHSVALSYMGQAFVWGSNEENQLGVDDTEVHAPMSINMALAIPDVKISAVSLGYDHTGILTDEGRLFVAGDNAFSQLGVSGMVKSDGFEEITDAFNDETIVALNFGHNSSSVITDENIYVFGYNFNYQLGLETNASVSVPTLLENSAFADKAIDRILIAKEVYVIVYEDGDIETYGPF